MSELKPMRMDAYYYGFDKTGDLSIDLILSAVACAGKAFHHTEQWGCDSPLYNERHRGSCPVDWIQNAANDAARRSTSPAVKALVEACRDLQAFRNGADGSGLGNTTLLGPLWLALAAVECEIGGA